jgi:hypothetical protein
MDSDKSVHQMTDEEVINQVVPKWAQALSWIYDHTVAPVDRLIDQLSGASTRQMIADFEDVEARRSQKN